MINTFVNATIDEPTYIYYLQGRYVADHILKLLRALYGLKQSLILWHKVLSTALVDFRFHPVLGVECLFSKGPVLVFFFMDNIISIGHPRHNAELNLFEQVLCKRFRTQYLGPPKWFLSIRILRNKNNRQIWLYQDSYIEKITTRYNLTKRPCPKTPLPALFAREKHSEQASN
jgi:hypothetical protein